MTVRISPQRSRFGRTFSISDRGGYWRDAGRRRRAWSTEYAAELALQSERATCDACGLFWHRDRLSEGRCQSCDLEQVIDDSPPTREALAAWCADNPGATLGDLARAFGIDSIRVVSIRQGLANH